MLKKLKKLGNSTLVSCVQGISHQGIWILVGDQEFFLLFAQFPWFLQSTIEQIYNVELHHGKHLHWHDIDVDLDLESLKNPEAYPLKYS